MDKFKQVVRKRKSTTKFQLGHKWANVLRKECKDGVTEPLFS
jgi:hypothetical protein